MKLTDKTREIIIDRLLDCEIDTLRQDNYYITSMLETGFVGFKNMTDKDLVDEYNERELPELEIN